MKSKIRRNVLEIHFARRATPGRDHNCDAQVHNLSIARFLIVAPTVLNMGVAIRNGQLHDVVVTMASGQRGFDPSAHVCIQEWFGPAQPSHMHVSERDRPWSAAVDFTSAVPEAVCQKAFGLRTACFTKTRGCRNAELTVQSGCPNTEKISQAIADHGFDGGLAGAGCCFGSFCAGG
jgi:hypothetical protein